MFSAAPSLDGDEPRPPDELAEAGRYPTLAAGSEHGLVVLAMGLPYWLVEEGGQFRLLVESARADDARHQLALFDRESVGWPPPAHPPATTRIARPIQTPLLWAWIVAMVFVVQQRWPEFLEGRAALDPQAVFEHGEWWRPLTALFLHASFVHLASNVAAGILVFTSLLTTLGLRRGWLMLIAAALAGNVLTAAVHLGTPYVSLGASTAVFAGIGLLTGHAVRAAWQAPRPTNRARAVFLPLAAGAILLGLLGAGDLRTDVVAHGAGFLVGAVLGACARRRNDA